LQAVPIAELVKDKGGIITAHLNDSIETVLHLLRDSGIVSVPVVDKWMIYARISTFDIMSYFFTGGSAMNLNRPISKVIKYMEQCVPNYRKEGTDYSTVVIPFQLSNMLTLNALWDPFSSGLHRLLVEVHKKDFNRNVLMNLSQTDVLRYINEHPYIIPDALKNKVLKSLNIISKNIVTVNSDIPVLDAFKKLNHMYMSAAVVVDPSSKAVISSLSSSDLRKLDIDTLNNMKKGMKVIDFLTTGRKLSKPLTITPNETLIEAINRMVIGNTHRLWLVDDNKIPNGVISMTDIMAVFTGRVHHQKGIENPKQ